MGPEFVVGGSMGCRKETWAEADVGEEVGEYFEEEGGMGGGWGSESSF